MASQERLSVDAAAQRLGITPDAVRSRIKRGTLWAIRRNGRVQVVLRDGLAKEEVGARFAGDRVAVHNTNKGAIGAGPSKDEMAIRLRAEIAHQKHKVRDLEREIGEERASVICEAALGANGIKLFLTIYGDNKQPDLSTREVTYNPREFGQLIRGFARSVEGISSMDKLDEAGIVSYLDDGNIHVNPRRSTAFYAHLRKLYQLLVRSSSLDRTPGH